MATDEPQVTGGEPRKKRAKIVSACSECRRKKTKCNGELPCRSCHKADVPCIYPAISHAEDKRNHLSKAALEAIEDRLKAIEDMLHTILQSQSFVTELPTAAVDQFLNNNNQVSSSPSSPTNTTVIAPQPYIHQQHQTDISSASPFVTLPPRPSTTQQQPLPPQPPLTVHSPQQQYQKGTTAATTTAITTSIAPDVRLPSIHDLSGHSTYSSPPPSSKVKQEETDTTDLPRPLGYSSYYAHNTTGRPDMPSDLPIGAENSLSDTIKKRKRTS